MSSGALSGIHVFVNTENSDFKKTAMANGQDAWFLSKNLPLQRNESY